MKPNSKCNQCGKGAFEMFCVQECGTPECSNFSKKFAESLAASDMVVGKTIDLKSAPSPPPSSFRVGPDFYRFSDYLTPPNGIVPTKPDIPSAKRSYPALGDQVTLEDGTPIGTVCGFSLKDDQVHCAICGGDGEYLLLMASRLETANE